MKKNFVIIFFFTMFFSQLLPRGITPHNNVLKKVKNFVWNKNFLLTTGAILWLYFLRQASNFKVEVVVTNPENSNLITTGNESLSDKIPNFFSENTDFIQEQHEENKTNVSNTSNQSNSNIDSDNIAQKIVVSEVNPTNATPPLVNDNNKGDCPKITNPKEKKQQVNYILDAKKNNQDDKNSNVTIQLNPQNALSENNNTVDNKKSSNPTRQNESNCNLEISSDENDLLKKYSNYTPLWKNFDEFENELKNQKITDPERTDLIQKRKNQEDVEIVNILNDFLAIQACDYTKDHEELLKLCGPEERWIFLLFGALPYLDALFMFYGGKINQIIAVVEHIKGNFLGEYYLHNLINFKWDVGNFSESEFSGKTFAEIIKKIYEITSKNSSFKEVINYKNHIYAELYEIKDLENDFIDEQYGMYKNSLFQLQQLTEEYLTTVEDIESIKKYVKEKKTLYGIGLDFDIRSITPFQWNLIIADFSTEQIGEWCKNDACLLQKLEDSNTPRITSILQRILNFEKDVGNHVDFSKIHVFFDYLSKYYLPELIVTFDYSNAKQHWEGNFLLKYPLNYVAAITKINFPNDLKETIRTFFIIGDKIHFRYDSWQKYSIDFSHYVASIIKCKPVLFFKFFNGIGSFGEKDVPELISIFEKIIDVFTSNEIFNKQELKNLINNAIEYAASKPSFTKWQFLLTFCATCQAKNHLTDEEISIFVNRIIEIFIEKFDANSIHNFCDILEKLSKRTVHQESFTESINQGIKLLLISLYSYLKQWVDAGGNKICSIDGLVNVLFFFGQQSKKFFETKEIKNLWADWNSIMDILATAFQDNDWSVYIGKKTQCHCKIRENLKNHPDLLALKFLLWNPKQTLEEKKEFLFECLKKNFFDLVICIFEELKETDVDLYKTLLNLCKFELCYASFQLNKKNEKLIPILQEYVIDFFQENYQQKSQYVDEELALYFIDQIIETKNNVYITSENNKYDTCSHHRENKFFQLFFECISSDMLDCVVEKFSSLKEADFLENGVNQYLIECVKWIGKVQFDRNLYHNQKTIADVVSFKVFVVAGLLQYPFLTCKDHNDILRLNKIINEDDKKYFQKRFTYCADDFFTKELSVDELVEKLKDKEKNFDHFKYYFDYATTYWPGKTYQERAHALINYMLSKEEYSTAFWGLRYIKNLLIKNDIKINEQSIIDHYIENGKIKKNHKDKINQFTYFLREFFDSNKIDASLAKIYLDYYSARLYWWWWCKEDHDSNEKKSFLLSLIQKADFFYNPLKIILILSTLQDPSLLKNYESYLEEIGFVVNDFMNLEEFIFPLIKAYNNTLIDSKTHCKKLIKYLLKNNVNFLEKYQFRDIQNRINKETVVEGISSYSYYIIPSDLLTFYIKCCKNIRFKKAAKLQVKSLRKLPEKERLASLNSFLHEFNTYKKNALKNLSQSEQLAYTVYSLIAKLYNHKEELVPESHNILELLSPLFQKTTKVLRIETCDSWILKHLPYLICEQLKNKNSYDGQKNTILHDLLSIASDYNNFENIIRFCKEGIDGFQKNACQLLSLKNHDGKTPLKLEKEMYPDENSCFSELPNLK